MKAITHDLALYSLSDVVFGADLLRYYVQSHVNAATEIEGSPNNVPVSIMQCNSIWLTNIITGLPEHQS